MRPSALAPGNGTSCPAMTPLRLLQGLTPPLHPAKAQGALPQFLGGKKFLQIILLAEQSANLSSRGAECVA